MLSVRKRRSPSSGATGGGESRRPRASLSGLGSWLPSNGSYAAAEGVTLAALVTYDVMGSKGKTKLPRPAPIVATLTFVAMLAAAGSVSRSWAPLATAVAWVVTLSVLVTGRRGAGLVGLLTKATGYVANLGGDNTSAAPAAATAH